MSDYTLRVTKAGYKVFTVQFKVEAGKETAVDAVLQPEA